MQNFSLPIGTGLQNNKYTLIKVLGQGGFGITYLAENKLMGKVVVKELFLYNYCERLPNQPTLQARISQDEFESFKDKFLEEARTLVKFKNIEGVVMVFDFFEENNTVYFVMEYVDALSMYDYVEKNGPMSEKQALQTIKQVGEALSKVHKGGVIHRDIKPHNILITQEGKAVLIDFGIARNFEEGHTAVHTTFFTPGYAAPEQMTMEDKRGAYTDIYSLGATLYYCLTGKHPQTLGDIAINGYTPPKQVNSTISVYTNAAITQAMKLKREERYPSVDAFLTALPLRQFLGERGGTDASFNKGGAPVHPPIFRENAPEETQFQSPPTVVSAPKSAQNASPIIQTSSNSGMPSWLKSVMVIVVLIGAVVAYNGLKDDKGKKKRREETTEVAEANVRESSSMKVTWVENPLSKGLKPEWQKSEFSPYEESHACNLKGYLILDGIEVSALTLRMTFIGENGDTLLRDSYDAMSDSDPKLRTGDRLPIHYLMYEKKAAPQVYKEVIVAVTYAEKSPSSAKGGTGKEVPLTFLNPPPADAKIIVRERNVRVSDGLKSTESFFEGDWEFENVGNTSFEMLKLQLVWVGKDGSSLGQDFTYIITDSDPQLQNGQRIVKGGTWSFNGSPQALKGYKLEVLEWK